ncbi:MAG: hypothetical protein C0485_18625 [Pirellula sp.]|nr:hypothetical protein [Pirellula sp.]
MSEELNQPPIAPTVRFGLRSMVAVTSIAAIFAAAAAPLSWGASEAAQRHLAVAWCTTLASVAATYVYYSYRSRHIPRKAGPVRYFGTTTWERPWSPEGPPLLFWIGVIASPGLLYLWFGHVAEDANRPDPSYGWTLWVGFFIGFMVAKVFRRMIPWPIAITDEGVVEYGKFLPWERFVRAECAADRSEIVRLHRRYRDYVGQGDPCIQFAPETESAGAAFLQERIAASSREG